MDLHLKNQVAMVVGGAGTIGHAIANSFAREGCQVCLFDNHPSTVALADSLPSTAMGIRGDVTHYEAVKQGFDQCLETWNRIDHVIYTAGVGSGKFGFPFWNLEPSDWPRVWDINMMGAVHVAHAFARHAIQNNSGTITFLTSVAGQIGSQTDPPYSAAKAALINFMQCVAKDLAPYQVRANALSPGMVQSDLNRSVWQAGQEQLPEEERQSYEDWAEAKIKHVSPLGKWQNPASFGSMATFLASEHAQHITGQVLNIDGGQVMHA
jgi:2-hydroxycyclohexanecarboxyl-CoA dehydrogenase